MWTQEHAEAARRQGWGVFDVWTGKSWKAVVLPLSFTSTMPHAHAMLNMVVQNAQMRDALCITALRHVKKMNT